MYAVQKITLKKPINVKDLTKENISTVFVEAFKDVNSSKDYGFTYNPTTQEENNALANAIFQAYGMSLETPEGATRYLVDKGSELDDNLKECNEYQVIEIQEDKVVEFTILIKSSSTEQEYISKLTNASNYRITGEKSCEMTGSKIGIENEVNTQSEEN